MRFWKPQPIKGKPTVGIAVAAYLGGEDANRNGPSLAVLVNSFKAQTYQTWKMLVVHDGPHVDDSSYWASGATTLTNRVNFITTPERKQQFGHPHRQKAIEELVESGCDWIGLTNQDNYYAPVYLEWMLSTAQEKDAAFVYCDCVHSHKMWKPLPGEVRRGHIDLGGFLVRRDVAEKIKFDKFTFAGDWDYISRVRTAAKKIAKVSASLFVHN